MDAIPNAPRPPKGARSLMLAQIVKALTLLLGVVILSRLLSPSEFGVVAVPITIVGIGEILRDLGLSAAATTYPNLGKRLRDLLFWINCGVATIMIAVVLATNQLLSILFDEPAIAAVLCWLSFVFLFNGLGAQYRADLTRRMKFSALAAAESFGAVAGVSTAIIFAISGASYWALVSQQIATAFVSTVIMISAARWLPGLPHRAAGALEMIKFGLSVSWSQVLMYLGNNVDVLALGYASNAREVGFYNRSFQVAVQPFTLLKRPATSVALPTMSRRANSSELFMRAAINGQKLITYTIFPVALFLSATAQPIVEVVLGSDWLPAAPAVAFLAAGSALQQAASSGNWMMMAKRKGAALRNYSAVSLLIKVACIVPLAHLGATAVGIGFFAGSLIASPIATVWACRVTGTSAVAYARSLAPSMGLIIFAGLMAFTTSYLLSQWHPVINILLSLVVAIFVVSLAATLSTAIRQDIIYVGNMLLRRSK